MPTFESAITLHIKQEDLILLPSGSRIVDQLLGGDIETGSITELIGDIRTGKRQICHTLAVTCQLPVSKGGAKGKCLYIDTENGFRSDRILAIASRFGLDGQITLANISVAHAPNSEQQKDLLNQASKLMSQSRYGILIVDSVITHFRTEYNGRGTLYDRQTELKIFLQQLSNIAQNFGIAVVITNRVIANVDGGMFGGNESKKPAGGHILSHASTTRLFLRKSRGDTRICKVYKSPCLPESEATFSITTAGIADEKDN